MKNNIQAANTKNVDNNHQKKIFLLAVGGNKPLNRLIRYFIKDPYVHVALALDQSLNELYAFNIDLKIKKYKFSVINGFVKETINDYEDDAIYSLYEILVTEKQYYQVKTMIEQFDKEADFFTYNFRAALGFAFKNLWRSFRQMEVTSFTCSEFIAYLLQSAGVISFKKPLYSLSPRDIFAQKEFKMISTGTIVELAKDLYGD